MSYETLVKNVGSVEVIVFQHVPAQREILPHSYY